MTMYILGCIITYVNNVHSQGDNGLKPKKIVVMQTVDGGREFCRQILESMRLVEYEDFVVLNSRPRLSRDFTPDTRQLFITGSFDGHDEGVAEMVAKAKVQNKQLVVVSFSTHRIAGSFDQHIPKGPACDASFKKVIQNFLDGTLTRTA